MELENVVRELLDNKDLELELVSPDAKYYFVYSTNIVAKETEVVASEQLTRTYWISGLEKSTSGAPAWGSYQHETQIESVTNLIRFAKYKTLGVYDQWQQKCPKCGNVTSGKIWRNSPKSCEAKLDNKKCGYEFTASDKDRRLNKVVFDKLTKAAHDHWERQKKAANHQNEIGAQTQQGLF